MYLQALKFVTPKRVGIAAVILGIFAAGWTTNGWRYQNKMARKQAEVVSDYAKQREAYLHKYKAQQQIDEEAAQALSADLAILRMQRSNLQEKLRSAAVVKSDDEICADGGSRNPFGADFARLWNDSAADQ